MLGFVIIELIILVLFFLEFFIEGIKNGIDDKEKRIKWFFGFDN